MSERFEKLLSPFQIKQVKLKNRMVKTSAAMGLATDDGYVTDANIGFYEALAKGGIGLITVEHGFIDYPVGVTGPRRIAINDDKYLPGLKKLTQAIHKYGTPCWQQLGHSGPAQRWLLKPGQRTVGPSEVAGGARELSIAEIQELVEKYAKGAARAVEAGYDGVEIHAAAGYLIATFLTRARNKRTDIYGPQSLENRARFLVEIVRAIKQRVGNDFPVGARMNGAEYGIENALTNEEAQGLAKLFQEAGGDFITMQTTGQGRYELISYPEEVLYPEKMVDIGSLVRKPGLLTPLAEGIKKAVTIPVTTVGRLDASLGEWILEQGKADLIGMNRRLLADHEYPNKIAAGKLEDIALCTACMECWASQQLGGHIVCRINASLGREYEMEIKPAAKKKKVVIVGAGPAGLEAARVSAMRGHEVAIYDKQSAPGGLLPLATLIKGTEIEDIPGMVAYFKTQLSKLGVQMKLGAKVSPELIQEAKPDVIIVATGGVLSTPDIPGIDSRKVVKSSTLHRTTQRYLKLVSPNVLRWLTKFYLPLGKRVIIVGGAMQGCELADFLVKRGRKVTVVETSDKPGTGIHEINRPRLIRWLTAKGVLILTGVKYEQIVPEGLVITTKEGERKTIEGDTILIATPPVPNTEFFDSLKGKAKEVYLIGDAKEPQTIVQAVAAGSQIARTI